MHNHVPYKLANFKGLDLKKHNGADPLPLIYYGPVQFALANLSKCFRTSTSY